MENIDKDVFNSLPDDIKKEIVMNYKIDKTEQETKIKLNKQMDNKESVNKSIYNTVCSIL